MAAVAGDGLSAVQFNMVSAGLATLPDAVPEDVIARVHDALAAHRVAPAALSGTYNLIHPDEARRRLHRDRLCALIDAAPHMGFGLVTLCTGTRDPDDQWRGHPDNASEDAWREMRAELDPLLAAAEAAGVRLGVEPELGNVVATPALARRLLGEAGTDRLVVVLDPANLAEHPTPESSREAVSRAIGAMGGRLGLAHAKDRRHDGSEAAAGMGEVDFAHYLGALDRAGYHGAVVLHGLAEAEVADAAEHLRRMAERAGVALGRRDVGR